MTDPLIAELEATNRLQADDIAGLKGALERAKVLEEALNGTIDALEAVVERQSRRLMEQAKTLEAVRATVTSDEAVEAFGRAWQAAAKETRSLPRSGSKRRAGLRAVADLIGGAE